VNQKSKKSVDVFFWMGLYIKGENGILFQVLGVVLRVCQSGMEEEWLGRVSE
jgi:hypothetical protein